MVRRRDRVFAPHRSDADRHYVCSKASRFLDGFRDRATRKCFVFDVHGREWHKIDPGTAGACSMSGMRNPRSGCEFRTRSPISVPAHEEMLCAARASSTPRSGRPTRRFNRRLAASRRLWDLAYAT